MMSDIHKAKELLQGGGYTCVLCNGEKICATEQRGVKPLLTWVESDNDFSGYSAADKVVGRGAAFLYVLLKVKAVYASVISKSALEVLEEYGICVEYGCLVDCIINRSGTGICPFEEAVMNIGDAESAYRAILQKMREMNVTI